ALQSARPAPDDLYTISGPCHGEKCTVADPTLEANNAAWLHQVLGPKQPTAPIQTGPSSSTPLAEASFTFTPGAGVSTECALDTAPPAPCTSPVSFVSLPPGQHTFTVQATDATGT